MIKKFENFKEKVPSYKYGCVKIDLDIKNWKELISNIDPKDLYNPPGDDSYGVQLYPHITLLYGFSNSVLPNDIEECLKDISGPIKIESIGIDIFKNPEFDVVKLNVKKTKTLERIFKNLSKIPNSNTFKTYMPHITIGFVKSGEGDKYIDPTRKITIDNISNIIYSSSSGEKFIFKI